MTVKAKFAARIRIIAGIVLLIGLVLIVRLYFLQVVHGKDFRLRAESQYVQQSTNQIDRGTIFFTARDGSLISAATIAAGDTIALNPTRIENPEGVYGKLKPSLPNLDRTTFLEKAGKKEGVYVEVAKQVPTDVGAVISALKIPGVQVLGSHWRYYPGKTLAAQTIGFLGFSKDGKSVAGQYGLERYYDGALSRSDGGLYVNFFADLFTNIRAKFSPDTVEPGADLTTSLEPTVQQFLEDALKKYDESWHADTVGGIIMDPKTGSIIAMASRPGFDLNDFKNADPNAFANPLVERVYEFGSTMKALTMAAGIDSGAVTPTTTYDDKGFLILDGARINNYDHKGRGVVSMQEVLNQSLNTGVSFVVQRMGTSTFASYFKRFGITDETGIDLPNEASPLVSNLQSPRAVEYATASFGQGIALTPVAMARALATLANGGVVPAPHVGLELRYGGGITKKLGWSPPVQAITPASDEAITRMLVTVVDVALQHGSVKMPDYSIAAKTGTAQIARPDARGYYTDRYLHSFFGYFPAYDPKFLVFFFAVYPKGAQYASETWTPPFMNTVHFLINYYNIPPDRGQSGQ
ncbi:MAG: penicillin-binding protein 2 [Patescibacteria group bacterium]